jgi:hypothetical protein
MSAAVSQIPVEDLDTLAYYVARFPGPVAVQRGRDHERGVLPGETRRE